MLCKITGALYGWERIMDFAVMMGYHVDVLSYFADWSRPVYLYNIYPLRDGMLVGTSHGSFWFNYRTETFSRFIPQIKSEISSFCRRSGWKCMDCDKKTGGLLL
jgi:hypothetical protein